MAESIPFNIKGDIVGYSAMDVCATGMNFYGPKGFFSPAAVTKTIGYEVMAGIELAENRFGADNVIVHYKDHGQLPFIFQTYGNAGPRIVAAVKEIMGAAESGRE